MPVGPTSPNQPSDVASGNPASATVGRSGHAEDRLEPLTASARKRPSRTMGDADGTVNKKKCTRFASVSVNASPRNLNGMCTDFAPAARLKISPAMCASEPTPTDPKLYLPGLARSKAASSCTFFTGRPGATTSKFGTSATPATGVKSFTGWYGGLGLSSAAMVCGGAIITIV